MRGRTSLLLEVIGLVLIVGSCVVFPGQSGPDYRSTNGESVFGVIVGAILILIGLAPYIRGGGPGPR
jgi:hypothetical protein